MDGKDPYFVAWNDQFSSLLKDKILAMMEAVKASGLDSIAHIFKDPFDAEHWRLVYEDGEFYITNLDDDTIGIFRVDLASMGIRKAPPE